MQIVTTSHDIDIYLFITKTCPDDIFFLVENHKRYQSQIILVHIISRRNNKQLSTEN